MGEPPSTRVAKRNTNQKSGSAFDEDWKFLEEMLKDTKLSEALAENETDASKILII